MFVLVTLTYTAPIDVIEAICAALSDPSSCSLKPGACTANAAMVLVESDDTTVGLSALS